MIHWGCIIVPTGYTADAIFGAGGNPSGTSATVDQNGNIREEEKVKAAIQYQVKRTVDFAQRLL